MAFARPSGDACDAGAFEFSRGATVAFVSQASSPGNTRSPQFAFEAEGDYGGFECRFYRQGEEPGPFGECESPYVPALDGEDDGAFVIEVRALDTNGDPTDSTATATYELDTTPPVTEILYPSSPFRFRPDLPDFHFEIESNARAECRVDSGSWEQCSSPWSPPSDLEAGRHQIRIRATDRAGNAESPHIIDVLIDNQAFVKAARKTLKPNRKGKVELKLTCPKSEWMSCFVWPIRIDTAKKVATRKGGGKNVLKVANVRDAYYIRSGKSRTVRFRLPGKIRRALQVNGAIPLIAKVQVEDELGNIESRRLRLKLRR